MPGLGVETHVETNATGRERVGSNTGVWFLRTLMQSFASGR